MTSLGLVALLVRDYDEGIEFFTRKMDFSLVVDRPLDGTKRWVVVRPRGNGCSLLLARAVGAEQLSRVGNQSGGRVFLFLETTDFWREYLQMVERGVVFLEKPREESYGTVAVFVDIYGNRWDLLQNAVNH